MSPWLLPRWRRRGRSNPRPLLEVEPCLDLRAHFLKVRQTRLATLRDAQEMPAEFCLQWSTRFADAELFDVGHEVGRHTDGAEPAEITSERFAAGIFGVLGHELGKVRATEKLLMNGAHLGAAVGFLWVVPGEEEM